jgi:uncharacterized protein YjiS (DUF1127 family)
MPTIIADFHTKTASESRQPNPVHKLFLTLKTARKHRATAKYLAQFDEAKLDDIGVLNLIRVVRRVGN